MDMEKAAGYVVNGGIRMPIGYRFYPTDEELVTYYLTRKNLGLPLPASVIPEFDVFQAAPWSLPGNQKEKYRYFFSNRYDNESINVNGNKRKGVAGSGFWKAIGKERLIVASGSSQPVGIKKTLVFYQGKHSHRANTSTRWLMHQYCLLPSAPTLDSVHQMMELFGDWFVYRIFQKKRKAKKHGVVTSNLLPNSSCNNNINTPADFIDFTVDDYSDCGPPCPSSPSSSTDDIVEDSSNGIDQEDISFPSYSWIRK